MGTTFLCKRCGEVDDIEFQCLERYDACCALCCDCMDHRDHGDE